MFVLRLMWGRSAARLGLQRCGQGQGWVGQGQEGCGIVRGKE